MVSDDGIILALVGMVEVYRELGTNLSRDVAIEVLFATVAQGRVARFERKAKVLDEPSQHRHHLRLGHHRHQRPCH
jgi:hypothetical protein